MAQQPRTLSHTRLNGEPAPTRRAVVGQTYTARRARRARRATHYYYYESTDVTVVDASSSLLGLAG